ncbi:MAG: DUF1998 domain-containing protein [Candidatus Poribacteria bacterium]|nr:DUF1998 domain-containing protein [Candidatus Poribacteria bacterium]
MKPIRRSQLISPWGVGSMIDFPGDESLMVCGLDAWPFAKEECPVDFKFEEERLQTRLRVSHFRLPPDYRRPERGVQYPNLKIPFVRFPQWHYCRRCGNMQELSPFGGSQQCNAPNYATGLNCVSLNRWKRPGLLPVRFVAVCEQGHIQDFPFMDWVHGDDGYVADCKLRLREGRSAAGLSGITIQCSCGKYRSMAGAFSEEALDNVKVSCGGLRPWLGDMTPKTTKCGHSLRVLQRGASNIYFAHVASSIYLPLWGEESSRRVVDLLEDPEIWQVLSSGLVQGKIDLQRCELLCQVGKCKGVDPQKLAEAAQRRLDGSEHVAKAGEQTEEEYRQAEYKAMTTARGSQQTDLYIVSKDRTDYKPPVQDYFENIMLVRKLRETRAFYGFSRFLPDDGRGLRAYIEDLRLDTSINWLPAIMVRGEGIFLKLDEERLAIWEQKSDVIERFNRLKKNYNLVRQERGQSKRQFSPKFVLIHTMAHLLINQLCFECGYGSASLRERIYCDEEDRSFPMSGVLIYTASGDSEGTLGGLVRQGEQGRLERVLIRALRTALWCSSDPTCVESIGQGPDSCNLAACHACALLSETSCEEGNRLLDRVLVVGSPQQPELGFFNDYLQSLQHAK